MQADVKWRDVAKFSNNAQRSPTFSNCTSASLVPTIGTTYGRWFQPSELPTDLPLAVLVSPPPIVDELQQTTTRHRGHICTRNTIRGCISQVSASKRVVQRVCNTALVPNIDSLSSGPVVEAATDRGVAAGNRPKYHAQHNVCSQSEVVQPGAPR